MAAIKNETDYVAILDRTILEIDNLVNSQPDYPVWKTLQRALEIIKASRSSATAPGQSDASINIGLIAARELEPTEEEWLQDLIERLYLIQQYWLAPTGRTQAYRKPARYSLRQLAFFGILAMVLLSALAVIVSVSTKSERGPWTANDMSPSRVDTAARIEISLDPYPIRLNPNPEDERYSVRLNINGKIVPLASDLPLSELRFGADILGDDGQQIWFFVEHIGAWDYRQGRRITTSDLLAANPDIPEYSSHDNSNDPLISVEARKFRSPPSDIFSGERHLYAFRDQLVITTPDFKETYRVDPQSLHAKLDTR